MRYAIVSDLHANLQAWNAVLLDIRSNRADHIISLGDVVGYGPSPAEVLQSVHENIHSFVMGNHDAVICRKLDDTRFNPQAQAAIRRTRQQLGEQALPFIASFPLLLDGGAFLCTHGDFTAPEAFNYILGEEDAAESWKAVHHPLLFAGHTHEPALYVVGSTGIPYSIQPQDFELEPGKRFLVNAGSVGCSRDSDARAAYCLYDTDANAVFWRRIPYDLDALRKEYERHELDPNTSVVLNADPRRGTIALRERLDFAPSRRPEDAAVGVTGIASLKVLQRRERRWKAIAGFLLSAVIILFAAAGIWFSTHSARPRRIGKPAAPIDLRGRDITTNILPAPHTSSARNSGITGWVVALGNHKQQSVEVSCSQDQTAEFILESAAQGFPLFLYAPEMRVTPGMQFYPSASFWKSSDFKGTIEISVALFRDGDQPGMESLNYYSQAPGPARMNGWARARRKFTIPARGSRIQLRVGGDFSGTVRIKDFSMSCAPPVP